jgi:hypothetical protein
MQVLAHEFGHLYPGLETAGGLKVGAAKMSKLVKSPCIKLVEFALLQQARENNNFRMGFGNTLVYGDWSKKTPRLSGSKDSAPCSPL